MPKRRLSRTPRPALEMGSPVAAQSRVQCGAPVAQIYNLPYRRFKIGSPLVLFRGDPILEAAHIGAPHCTRLGAAFPRAAPAFQRKW
jgi:hypothetical protein